MYEIVQPTEKLSKDSIRVWRISAIITYIILIAISGALLFASYHFDWVSWVQIGLWVITGLFVLLSPWSIFIDPGLSYRYFHYGIDENYVRIYSGIFFKTDLVVPMTKIQYVEADQGPLLRKYKLQSITIGTLGSSHEIPALNEAVAFELRDKISTLAKIKEVE